MFHLKSIFGFQMPRFRQVQAKNISTGIAISAAACFMLSMIATNSRHSI